MNIKQKKKMLQQMKPKQRTFTEKEMMEFAEKIIISYLASSIITLRDKFGFGKVRIERFLKGESNHAQAMKQGYVTPDEIFEQIKKETDFDLKIFIENQYKEMDTNGKN